MFLEVINHSSLNVIMSLNISSCLHSLRHNSQKTGPGGVFMLAKEEQNQGLVLALLAV